jgi:hypothetical protein
MLDIAQQIQLHFKRRGHRRMEQARMTVYPQVALTERACPAGRKRVCWPGPTQFGYCCKPLPENRMTAFDDLNKNLAKAASLVNEISDEIAKPTAQPSREELLAAIVEWDDACNAVHFERATWHGYTAPGGPSAPSEYRKAKAMDTLGAIAKHARAERAEGKGHAGA